jgi:hypothetical protein
MIEPDSIIWRSQIPVETQIDGEVVLMNLDRDRCYGLGKTGSDVWRRLSSPIQVSSLCSDLETEYEASPGEILVDVLSLLKELAAEDLIEVKGDNLSEPT